MTETTHAGRKAVKTSATAGSLTRWVQLALCAHILVALIGSVCEVLEYRLLVNYEQAVYPTLDAALLDDAANSARMDHLLLLRLALFVGSAVLMLCWIHRASFNLWQFRGQTLRFTPVGAVLGFLIPPVFFWRPLQVMKEIHAASHMPNAALSGKAALPVLLWWWSWLALLVLAVLCGVSVLGTDLHQQKTSSVLFIVFNLTLTCLAVLSLALVDGIDGAQARHGFRPASVAPPAGQPEARAPTTQDAPCRSGGNSWRWFDLDLTRKQAIGVLIILWWVFCLIGTQDDANPLPLDLAIANALFAFPVTFWSVQLIHAVRGDKDRLSAEIIVGIGVWGYVWRFYLLLVLATLICAVILAWTRLAPGEVGPSLTYFIASNLLILLMMSLLCWLLFSRNRKAQLYRLLSIRR